MAIEDYTHILYRDTTIIARGTVNPLRWLDYSFAAQKLSDPRFLPKPEKQLRDSRGEVKLRFPIGKAAFDAADPQNAVEIDKLRRQIEDIAHSDGASIQSLSLEGTSSPDGKYASTSASRRSVWRSLPDISAHASPPTSAVTLRSGAAPRWLRGLPW